MLSFYEVPDCTGRSVFCSRKRSAGRDNRFRCQKTPLRNMPYLLLTSSLHWLRFFNGSYWTHCAGSSDPSAHTNLCSKSRAEVQDIQSWLEWEVWWGKRNHGIALPWLFSSFHTVFSDLTCGWEWHLKSGVIFQSLPCQRRKNRPIKSNSLTDSVIPFPI